MAAHVFKRENLAGRIATYLLAISPGTTVALALTCRDLEVPILRILWEKEDSLIFLIKRVLPTDIQYYVSPPDTDFRLLSLQRPLTSQEMDRLKRYASWMGRLDVREWGLSEEITRLFLPSSDGIPPALPLRPRELSWWLNKTNLSFLPKFISPDLAKVIITTNAFARSGETVEPWDENLPSEVAPVMRSAIKMFPSSLQVLHIQLGVWPETHLTEEISAFILRSGETLREFSTNSMMSGQAIVHLMKLPNLLDWTTDQGPPQVTDLIRHGIPDGAASLFPSLKVLKLRGEAALEWLTLFREVDSRTPLWIMAGSGLPVVTYYHPTLPIDSSLVSRFLPLTDLVEVKINMECLFRPCVLRFTDQDVEHLAIALPKLKVLVLGGWPCDSNTCPTTIRSLFVLSIHCMKLKFLNIHFRTSTLRADMLDMLGYAYSAYTQNQNAPSKCW